MSKGLLLAAIASDPMLRTEGKVLEVLEHGNDVLVDTLTDFVAVIEQSGKLLSSFWEQKISNIGKIIGDKRIEVSKDFSPLYESRSDIILILGIRGRRDIGLH